LRSFTTPWNNVKGLQFGGGLTVHCRDRQRPFYTSIYSEMLLQQYWARFLGPARRRRVERQRCWGPEPPYFSTPPAWQTYSGRAGPGYGEAEVGAATALPPPQFCRHPFLLIPDPVKPVNGCKLSVPTLGLVHLPAHASLWDQGVTWTTGKGKRCVEVARVLVDPGLGPLRRRRTSGPRPFRGHPSRHGRPRQDRRPLPPCCRMGPASGGCRRTAGLNDEYTSYRPGSPEWHSLFAGRHVGPARGRPGGRRLTRPTAGPGLPRQPGCPGLPEAHRAVAPMSFRWTSSAGPGRPRRGPSGSFGPSRFP
jgi:hypothetical protein